MQVFPLPLLDTIRIYQKKQEKKYKYLKAGIVVDVSCDLAALCRYEKSRQIKVVVLVSRFLVSLLA